MLKEQNNSIKAFKLGFQLSKVKSPQEEEKEMKYTLAFHAEGKNASMYGSYPYRSMQFTVKSKNPHYQKSYH